MATMNQVIKNGLKMKMNDMWHGVQQLIENETNATKLAKLTEIEGRICCLVLSAKSSMRVPAWQQLVTEVEELVAQANAVVAEPVSNEVAVTDKELVFLNSMKTTNYGNPIEGEPTWWFAIETPFEVNVAKGITASLVKKGLIFSEYQEDDGEYMSGYTKKGLDFMNSLVVEPVVEEVVTKAKKKKLSDNEYLAIAAEFLLTPGITKKELASKHGIDASTISDMFSEKYCRKSCKAIITEMKGGN